MTVSVMPAGVMTATTVGNASKYVSAEADVPTVQPSALNVMKNVPIVEMLKSAADVISVKTVQVEKDISAITVKPASIVQHIFAIAETVVLNVARYAKVV